MLKFEEFSYGRDMKFGEFWCELDVVMKWRSSSIRMSQW